jgi:hypothetical protein
MPFKRLSDEICVSPGPEKTRCILPKGHGGLHRFEYPKYKSNLNCWACFQHEAKFECCDCDMLLCQYCYKKHNCELA